METYLWPHAQAGRLLLMRPDEARTQFGLQSDEPDLEPYFRGVDPRGSGAL